MAFLQKIRNKPKLLISIIAIALLAFIFPWNEFSSFINGQKNKAFEVNGDNISIESYMTRLQNFENFQKVISGQSSFDENTTQQIREYVYQQMIKEIMLDEQTLKLGIKVTNEELNELLFGANPSQILRQIPLFVNPQTGQFDPATVSRFAQEVNQNPSGLQPQEREILKSYKSLWDTILNLVKYTRLEEKYTTLVASTDIVNNIEIEAAKEATTVSSNMAYVLDRYSSMPDSSVTVTNAEVEKLYNDRKSNFRTNEDLVKVSYITKEIVPSESDYEVASKQVNEAIDKLKANENPTLVLADYSEVPYQDFYFSINKLSPEEGDFAKSANVGDVYGPIRDTKSYKAYKLVDRIQAPDSVKLSLIMIPGTMDGTNTAANRADSIINVINGGKSFAMVANELNPQQPNGGLLGWITEAELGSAGKNLITEMFKTPVGQTGKATVEGNIAIFKVEDKSQPVNKYKLAYVQVPVVTSEQTTMKVDNELNQFISENTDPATFVKAAQEKGYNVTPNSFLFASYPNIAQIAGSREVVRWAFTNKEGTIKKFDLTNNRIIAVIDSKIIKDYAPLSQVEDILRKELVDNKKAEKMIADLKSKNLTSLQAYAQSLNTKVDTAKYVTFNTANILGIGKESVLNAYAEVGQANKLEGPIKGDNGVLVVQVLDRTDDNANFNPVTYKEQVSRQNLYTTMTQAMNVLQQKMKVKDNRINIGL